jgi:hypothetical protein
MKLKTIHLAALAAISLASSAHAVTVTWGPATTISSSTDVSTNGTQVFGRNIAVESPSDPSAIVNGANFAWNNPGWTVGFTESGFPLTFGMTVPTLSGPDATNYQTILTYAREAYPTPTGTFTLSNLTLNQQYEIQIWVADYRNFTNDRTLTITAAGDSASPALTYLDSDGPIHGQFITGTFTADVTSVTFTMTGNEDAMYNAMQLRAIPEPSAALLGGLGMLALLRRRRS